MTIRKEKDIEDFIYDVNRKWKLSIEERDVLESLLYTFFRGEDLKQIHNALNDENKKKFADMVHKSPAHLAKASDFAFSRSK